MSGQNIARWEMQTETQAKKGMARREASEPSDQQDVLEPCGDPQIIKYGLI